MEREFRVNIVVKVVCKDFSYHPTCGTRVVTFETYWDVPYVPRVGETVLVPCDPGRDELPYSTKVEEVQTELVRKESGCEITVLLGPIVVDHWNEFGICWDGPNMHPGWVMQTFSVR